ncbi:hypothetical protein [Streptomyces sp. NPDC006638]|uniref:hypothetical protein n=1 Tax=Streptomyces sp. NPDC006638 TaxID=3157183 RepID=UPI0033BE32BE
MRVILVSYSVQGFALLHRVCERTGRTPVAYVHARSLRPAGPTRCEIPGPHSRALGDPER